MNKYLASIIALLAVVVIGGAAFMLIPRHPKPHASGIPPSQWKLSGYENPKSTILSAAAAIRNDDGQAFVDALTPEFRKYFEFCMQPAMQKDNKTLAQLISARAPHVAPDATIHIIKQKVLSDRWAQAVVKISAGGKSQTLSVALRNIDGQWKVDSLQ